MPSVRVSVFRLERLQPPPHVVDGRPGRNPLGSGLGVSSQEEGGGGQIGRPTPTSQSPRFGSRCFVEPLRVRNRGGVGASRNPLGSGLGVSSHRLDDCCPGRGARRRNPLGSGLGVSSARARRGAERFACGERYLRSSGPGGAERPGRLGHSSAAGSKRTAEQLIPRAPEPPGRLAGPAGGAGPGMPHMRLSRYEGGGPLTR